MAKKPVPAKAKPKTPAKAAPKKAAPPAKNAKKANSKPVLKSKPKTDVKSPAMAKSVAKAGLDKKLDKKKVVASAKAEVAPKGAKEVKAALAKAAPTKAVAAPVPTPALTKAPKVAKGKVGKVAKVAAPKNYDDMCREIGCESHCTTAGYCRLHYIKNWKKIKRKELILREKKLNQYIEELVSKYPDKYIEAIKNDLSDEKAFSKVIYDLELDESVDDIPSDEEADESIIDNIKRDFDDTDTDF